MAKFLQDTIEEMSLERIAAPGTDKHEQSRAQQFSKFLKEVNSNT